MRTLEPKFVVYDADDKKSKYGIVDVLKDDMNNSFYVVIGGETIELSQISSDCLALAIDGETYYLRSEDGEAGEFIDNL